MRSAEKSISLNLEFSSVLLCQKKQEFNILTFSSSLVIIFPHAII